MTCRGCSALPPSPVEAVLSSRKAFADQCEHSLGGIVDEQLHFVLLALPEPLQHVICRLLPPRWAPHAKTDPIEVGRMQRLAERVHAAMTCGAPAPLQYQIAETEVDLVMTDDDAVTAEPMPPGEGGHRRAGDVHERERANQPQAAAIRVRLSNLKGDEPRLPEPFTQALGDPLDDAGTEVVTGRFVPLPWVAQPNNEPGVHALAVGLTLALAGGLAFGGSLALGRRGLGGRLLLRNLLL
jgi:hypothetical protein